MTALNEPTGNIPQVKDVPLVFPEDRIVRENPNKTGGPGDGGGMDNLERRVTGLEEDVKVIRNDLTKLMVRSEVFATKAEISDLRGEIKTDMTSLRGELKTEMAGLRGEIKTDMASLRGELKTEMAELRGELKAELVETKLSILNAIEEKSRWKWGSVFIPLGVGVMGVLATLLAAHFSG